jgi:hypothetical protein
MNAGSSADKVWGFYANMGSTSLVTTEQFGFLAETSPSVTINSNYCDFMGRIQAGGAVRETIGCGPTFANTFNGPTTFQNITINGTCTGTGCGGGGGSGTVTSFAAPSGSWPAWLVPTVTNAPTTPSLAVAASAIPNAALANSSTTVNGVTCTLGSTCTVSGGSSGISGLTAGFIPLAGSATTLTANSHLNDGITTAATITSTEPFAVNDGTGKAGAFGLLAGTAPLAAPANTVQINAPTAVTAYAINLPGAQPTAGNTRLDCTAANPSICSWAAAGGGTGFPITLGSTPIAASSTTTTLAGLTLTAPTLTAPALGTPASGVMTNVTGLPLTTGVTGLLPVANGGTGTATPSIVAGTNVTISGTWPNQTINSTSTASTAFSALTTSTNSAATMTVGTGATLTISGTGVNNANQINGAATPTSACAIASNGSSQLTALTCTGTGNNVLATSPTLVTPVLGTPTSVTLTNATGLPLSTGVTGLLPNANLANASTTVNGTTCTLGSSCTVTAVATSMLFSGLTSATNTAAAMVVGAGASLNFASTGTINASTLGGATFAAPGTIGSTTPNTGSFSALTDTALTISNAIPKNSSVGLLSESLIVDNGTTATYSGTGGYVAPVFVANGATAGFIDFPQGVTSAAVSPCSAATSICEQAPASVTSYLVNKPGAGAQGIVSGTLSGSTVTQSISGDSGHAATVTIGSATSIGSTSLCSTTLCPAGTYRVNAYVDVTTACGTSGTYSVSLVYTDDQGSKTFVVPIQGAGTAAGVLTTTSTSNFGETSVVLRSTGAASINYLTTAVACGTAGPMIGKLYLSTEAVQ